MGKVNDIKKLLHQLFQLSILIIAVILLSADVLFQVQLYYFNYN